MPLNHDRPFVAVNIAIRTVSDTRGAADDRSGDTLVERAAAAGHNVVARKIVRDEFDDIIAQLRAWIADPDIDVAIARDAILGMCNHAAHWPGKEPAGSMKHVAEELIRLVLRGIATERPTVTAG